MSITLKNSISSIAIGSFDGIHKGHRELISQVEAVVVIERNGGYLTPGYKRTEALESIFFFYHFEHIKSLSARAFVERLCEDFPQLQTIVVGYDFGFGYKKEGDVTLLKELFHGEVVVVDEVKEDGISIHTRTIKGYIEEGDMRMTHKLLGRYFTIEGEVVSGQGLGKKELVATLNLKVDDFLLPKGGVYATETKIKGEWLASLTFLGHRLTTDGSYAIESHIVGEDIGDVRGSVSIRFLAFMRDNKKFKGLEALKLQIEEDISKRILLD